MLGLLFIIFNEFWLVFFCILLVVLYRIFILPDANSEIEYDDYL